jgi:hypothetical protein
LKSKHKKAVSLPTLSRLLQALDLPRKKSLYSSERDTPRVQQARAEYSQEIERLDVRHLKFVDESGVNLALTRLYGRAPRGQRVVGNTPINYGENVSLRGHF